MCIVDFEWHILKKDVETGKRKNERYYRLNYIKSIGENSMAGACSRRFYVKKREKYIKNKEKMRKIKKNCNLIKKYLKIVLKSLKNAIEVHANL